MQDMTPQISESAQLIQKYGDGGFVIGEQDVMGPTIVWRDHHDVWQGVNTAKDITQDALAQLLTEQHPIEIIVIGTGESMAFIAPDVRRFLRDKGIGLEVLDTGAACRTFNILLAEERRVAAALLPV